MDKRWLEFEKAVARFVSAVDPSARVTHDVKLPDSETGSPRQRDVWVEGMLCGLFQIKVLISCKRYSRPINQKDIDHFRGELLSSSAQKGVIYSFSRFNEKAIEKAKKLGISCFHLFENQSAEIPEHIRFSASYCLYQNVEFRLIELEDPKGRIRTWGDIFQIFDFDIQKGRRVELVDFYAEIIDQASEKARGMLTNGFPPGFRSEVTIRPDDFPDLSFRTRVTTNWRIYKGKIEAYMVDGSYSVTEKNLVGSISTPAVDLSGLLPGPGWEQIFDTENEVSSFAVSFIFRPENMAGYIRASFFDVPAVLEPDEENGPQNRTEGTP